MGGAKGGGRESGVREAARRARRAGEEDRESGSRAAPPAAPAAAHLPRPHSARRPRPVSLRPQSGPRPPPAEPGPRPPPPPSALQPARGLRGSRRPAPSRRAPACSSPGEGARAGVERAARRPGSPPRLHRGPAPTPPEPTAAAPGGGPPAPAAGAPRSVRDQTSLRLQQCASSEARAAVSSPVRPLSRPLPPPAGLGPASRRGRGGGGGSAGAAGVRAPLHSAQTCFSQVGAASRARHPLKVDWGSCGRPPSPPDSGRGQTPLPSAGRLEAAKEGGSGGDPGCLPLPLPKWPCPCSKGRPRWGYAGAIGAPRFCPSRA